MLDRFSIADRKTKACTKKTYQTLRQADGLWKKMVLGHKNPTHVDNLIQPKHSQTKTTKESWIQQNTGVTSLDETPTQELRKRKEKYMDQIRLNKKMTNTLTKKNPEREGKLFKPVSQMTQTQS